MVRTTMLPDLPEVKKRAFKCFSRAVDLHVVHHSPILGRIKKTRFHEGREGTLTRADKSEYNIQLQPIAAEMVVDRSQMRRISFEELFGEIAQKIARQLAEQQTRMMFDRIGEAAQVVGNDVDAREIGVKAAFLEMERRVSVNFNPETLEPKELLFVCHPSQAAWFKGKRSTNPTFQT